MSGSSIDQLIINSPYTEPQEHWRFDSDSRTFERAEGRRPPGYLVASSDSKAFDDPGTFVEIEHVAPIRERVAKWRESGYPGATGITRRLLEFWNDAEERENRRFFFCQLEAVETLIWLTEGPDVDKVGIDLESDGGPFRRYCAKMATGTGKTVVMAMVVSWHILNKVNYPQYTRYSKNILVIAPGLTVKNRLAVLDPNSPTSYYDEFHIVPTALLEKLRQGSVLVRNWHALNWENAEQIAKRRGVDKRGPLSDEAYVRDVLGDMASSKNLLVINDEAHHAWRVRPDIKTKGVTKAEKEEATKWIGGLDRIHAARGILAAYDFTATPFVPTGKQSSDEAIFGWIVSDFGLNDAIESGLVKTPRIVVQDDALPNAKTYKSRLYHIYNDPQVKPDLSRKAEPAEPLPDLVSNAYLLLGADWRATAENWEERAADTPPVMITVANRTETAARVKHAFDRQNIDIKELCDSTKTLHIDSKVIALAETSETPIAEVSSSSSSSEDQGQQRATKKQSAELLRQQVDTVGRPGKPGAEIQNVISVGMLTEGWDAKTVTHIMGLRAFGSQLLCEQVVGRGLRRTSYDVNPETGLFESEYVNVFGIPFSFLPHEDTGTRPPPTTPKFPIEPVSEKAHFEIHWPNVVRIDHVLGEKLSVDWSTIPTLRLNASDSSILVELAPVIGGSPDLSKIADIDLFELTKDDRFQTVVFKVVQQEAELLKLNRGASNASHVAQLFRLVDRFMQSDKIEISPRVFNEDPLRRQLILRLSMSKLVQHLMNALVTSSTEDLKPHFDPDRPIQSTADMRSWYTRKPRSIAAKCHINHCVADSGWEQHTANALDGSKHVAAWVKNDHLGFEIVYLYNGIVHKYRPDFLIKLESGNMLIVETKGIETAQDKAKFASLEQWVAAVNSHKGFGRWDCDVVRKPDEIVDILETYSPAKAA